MKIEENPNNNVERNGVTSEQQFVIKSSPEAFQILASGIYSNKEQAVIRELSTNAVDAHIEAEVDKPFDVHLPTIIEPFFSIRDYGNGLSKQDAQNLYTTFFESDKRNTDNLIGCLGLGSKSPFSLTDSFTVESFYKGEKTIYTAYKDEEGYPKLATLETVPTDEPSGVKIQFPVASSHAEWAKEANRVYKFFNNKPNCNIELDYELGEPIFSGNGWTIYNFSNGLRGNYAVMGSIAYPIDFYSFKNNDPEQQKIFEKFYSASGFIFKFKIGDLAITPSRESLSYTNKTKNRFFDFLKNVLEEILPLFEGKIESSIDLYHARLEFLNNKILLENQFGTPFVEECLSNLNVLYKGEVLFNDDWRDGTKTYRKTIKLEDNSVSYFCIPRRKGVVTRTSSEYDFSLNKNHSEILLLNDGSKSLKSRIKAHRRNQGRYTKDIYLFSQAAAKELCDQIGWTVKPVAEFFESNDILPIPEVRKRSSSAGSSSSHNVGLVEKYSLDSSGFCTDKDFVNLSVRNDSGFYLIRDRGNYTFNSKPNVEAKVIANHRGEFDLHEKFSMWIKVAANCGYKLPSKVYVLSKSKAAQTKISERKQFTNLMGDVFKFLQNKAKEKADEFKDLVSKIGFGEEKESNDVVTLIRNYCNKDYHSDSPEIVQDHPFKSDEFKLYEKLCRISFDEFQDLEYVEGFVPNNEDEYDNTEYWYGKKSENEINIKEDQEAGWDYAHNLFKISLVKFETKNIKEIYKKLFVSNNAYRFILNVLGCHADKKTFIQTSNFLVTEGCIDRSPLDGRKSGVVNITVN